MPSFLEKRFKKSSIHQNSRAQRASSSHSISMPSPRNNPPTPQKKGGDDRQYIKGRLYSATKGELIVHVDRQRGEDGNFVAPEGVIGDMGVQPRIHETEVMVKRAGQGRRYTVFWKRHTRLPLNTYAPSVGNTWKGDLLVLQRGCGEQKSYVHLRAGDTDFSRQAVEGFLDQVDQSKSNSPAQIEVNL
ncbi:hypothetical protein NP233_g7129 [Leucocoprinus birnbaumii]|uniref:Uncharacterized protein n=1 Tax=Leucocoprinus birnbaumii TaxID=56174 RepID=A0AAD5VPX4_9AGAR|nr:hypothetical protein NP233_g7129 [Leucocoprinus birnbaumii]